MGEYMQCTEKGTSRTLKKLDPPESNQHTHTHTLHTISNIFIQDAILYTSKLEWTKILMHKNLILCRDCKSVNTVVYRISMWVAIFQNK